MRTPFLILRQAVERRVCHVATRGRHVPSWAAAIARGLVDRPACRNCGHVLPRGTDAPPAAVFRPDDASEAS